MKKNMFEATVAAAIVLVAGTAMAEFNCQAARDKAVGGYYACRQKATSVSVAKGTSSTDAMEKCRQKFQDKWAAAAIKGTCPTAVPADLESVVSGQATVAANAVAGVASCGNNAIDDAGEQCDGTQLDGLTCASFGLYGTLACTAGCQLDLGGCTACPASTLEYHGACWVLSAIGKSCNEACTSLGLTYDTATSTIAGSLGTDDNCAALLYALNTTGTDITYVGDCAGYGFGCNVLMDSGTRSRCTTPATDGATSEASTQRVCACK